MSEPVAFHHPSSVEHETGDHPERPARMTAIERALDACEWAGFERRPSPAVARELLEAVHPPAHLDGLAALCAAGGGRIDADTVVSEGSWDAVLHAAGGTVAMVEELVASGAGAVGASLHRPPGHHAEPARAMGFCLVNHVAVAARCARDLLGVERVLIVDWDVHHGNGTEAIFAADPSVTFCSIHQMPLYPGTGAATDEGIGAGRGATVNLPVPPGSGDDAFRSLLEHVIAPIGRELEPGLILVSAGFDAHVEDPLASCAVTDDGFAAMAAAVRELAAVTGAPLGIVLEGGYALDALARSVAATMGALTSSEVAGPLEEHALAGAARERLAPAWPSLRA